MKFLLKLRAFIIFFLACTSSYKALAQTTFDVIRAKQKIEMPKHSSYIADSLRSESAAELDLFDSLNFIPHQTSPVGKINGLDSIHIPFNKRTDSLRLAYNRSLVKLNSSKSFFHKALDSLTTRSLPKNHILEKLDSVTKRESELRARFVTKLKEMKDQGPPKILDLHLVHNLADKAKAITGNINEVALPCPPLKLRWLEGDPNSMENLNGIGILKNFNSPSFPTEIENVAIPQSLSGAGRLTKPTLPTGDITDIDNLSKAAEEKAKEISGIQKIEEQTGGLTQYKEAIPKPPNQDSIKEMAIAQLRSIAVNHFAGKEQLLQEAMETMSKYKKKYTSVVNISELPKKRPNEMRDKPLIERIIPGIAMQIHKEGDDFMVDFNAYAAYRFTRKINGGIGWNQRVAYNMNYNAFNSEMRIFGPRIFGEYNLWKGFSPRAELELMNTILPPVTRGSTPDTMRREWVWGAFVGLKKEYRIIKNIKGTAMVMTRLFNPDNKSPYADVLNVRFGFEFPVKKKASVSDMQ